jgi:hypothetical protein
VTPSSNDDDHFIEMPEIAWCRPNAAQITYDRGSKLKKTKAQLRTQIPYISIA